MRLYDFTPAPGPRRARMFIAEKGLRIELVQIDLMRLEQFSPDFRAKNPACTVPVLELDDGRTICENVAIAAYLEAMHPDPPLMGRDAFERAQVLSWNARIESGGVDAISEAFRNADERFEGRGLTGPVAHSQIKALVERGAARARAFLDALDESLAASHFVCGDAFSLADIAAFVVLDFAAWIGVEPLERHAALTRWRAEVAARPSARA